MVLTTNEILTDLLLTKKTNDYENFTTNARRKIR